MAHSRNKIKNQQVFIPTCIITRINLHTNAKRFGKRECFTAHGQPDTAPMEDRFITDKKHKTAPKAGRYMRQLTNTNGNATFQVEWTGFELPLKRKRNPYWHFSFSFHPLSEAGPAAKVTA